MADGHFTHQLEEIRLYDNNEVEVGLYTFFTYMRHHGQLYDLETFFLLSTLTDYSFLVLLCWSVVVVVGPCWMEKGPS